MVEHRRALTEGVAVLKSTRAIDVPLVNQIIPGIGHSIRAGAGLCGTRDADFVALESIGSKFQSMTPSLLRLESPRI